ncbi:MAG: DUF418 domain-containing protein [Paenisporosarcina sp.]
MNVAPTQLSERVVALDMMRGFSLLGIFIVNMLAFHTPFYYIDPYSWFQIPADKDAFQWIDIVIQGSVYPLFSMLFGYGLAMQYEKAMERGVSFTNLALRRLFVLLSFGIIHAFFIWSGDILITYAISGLLLMWVLRLSAKWLVGIALVLYIVPNFVLSLISYIALKMFPEEVMVYSGIQKIESSIVAFGSGSWMEIFAQRAADWNYANGPAIVPFLLVTIFPYMMLGAAASKAKLIQRTAQKKTFWFILIGVTLAIGTFIKFLPYTLSPNYFTMYVQDIFGGPLQAIAYAGVIALLCQLSLFRKIFSPVAKAGRMSMTTYLTQSIVATTIFYSYGFGLYGKVDVMTGTWMAIGIFVIQLIFAEIWLTKFKQGPVEALWKRLTYGNENSRKLTNENQNELS